MAFVCLWPRKSDAALAVRSIPAYVELSNVFVALVPELTHKDSSDVVNYASWLSRGWLGAFLGQLSAQGSFLVVGIVLSFAGYIWGTPMSGNAHASL